MSRLLRMLALISWGATACSRGAEPSSPAAEVIGNPPPPSATEDGDPTDEVAASKPEPTPAESEEVEIYERLIIEVTAGAAGSAESEAQAWVHYKAKRFVEAQREFALASLHDRDAWKHPFNLACASARARDEAMVRVGLVEAVARDAEAAAAKAREDGDLAPYRGAPWFETIVGPKPVREPSEYDPELPVEADLVGPKLGEPHPLPPGRHVAIADAKLEQVRSALMDRHGLYPQIRATLEFVDETGAARGYVVYDYSVVDECMLRRHKKVCLERYGEGPQFDRYDRRHCTEQWIARVSFAETVALEARRLRFSCGPANVYRLDLLDADQDGTEEIVIDVRSRAELLGMRYTSDYLSGRILEIHRLDGSAQFQFEHHIHTFEIINATEQFRRVVVRDLNEDGHIDFVIQSRELDTNSRYDIDAEFWPDPADKRHVSVGGLTTEVRVYKPEKDTW